MRITAIRRQRLLIPLDPPFPAAWDPVPRTEFPVTIVRVETDEGVVGVGSGDTMDGFEAFEHLFIGQDPLAIARHVRALETIDFHAGRYWPLEVALWDIAGQVAGLPVATLFGGALDRIPAYASCGMLLPAAARAESAVRLCEEGFRALKIRVDPRRLEDGLAAVAATAARPSSSRRGSTRILSAPNPSSRRRSADSARAAGLRCEPHEAYAGIPIAAPPNSVATGTPATWPAISHNAASSGQ